MTVAADAEPPHLPPPRAPYDARDVAVIGGAAVAAGGRRARDAVRRPAPAAAARRADRHPGDRLRLLDQPARHRPADGGLGPRPADRVRAARAQDHRRAARVPDARRRDQPAARLRGRRLELRVRSARRQGGVAADHDRRARRRRGALRRHLRVPGAADDHLHRGAVRHPLLLRRDAARRAGVRRRDAPGDARDAAPSRSTWRPASSWGRPRRR